jgi:pimeloyl-ACP methyl ester carboxylesterase
MVIEKMANVGPSRIEVAYELLGDPNGPPVLLLMGGGMQLIHWPDGFCAELVARGLRLIRFDNRDAGESSTFSGGPVPDVGAALAGDLSSASYTLSEMANDAVGLLDALGLKGAHLVGASMGGMIAQTIAIEHPARVRSLTSIMATTGAPSVGQADFAQLAKVGPQPPTREDAIEWAVRAARALGSPGFEFDEAAVRERSRLAYDRNHDPLGFARQAVAVVASGDRTARLRSLTVPTLVIHGASDRLCDVSGGRATAEAVPGAELLIVEGLAHDLPRALWPQVASRIAALVERAEHGA